MPLEVRVPMTGESVAEATVGAWLKREGERVQAGEALVELETDKVNLEVSADRSGVLESIKIREGETVRPGDVLAIIGDAVDGRADRESGRAGEAGTRGDGPEAAERPHASPLAARIAQDHGIDLSQVPGTGTAGRVTREDVERYLQGSEVGGQGPGDGSQPPRAEAEPAPAQPTSSPASPAPGRAEAPAPPPSPQPPTADPREERIRMSRRRQTIAQRLVQAQQTAAILTTFNEVDMGAVMELRARRRDGFRERHGVGLGFMSFFTRAVVGGLKAFPRLNAEIRGDEIVLKRYYDIGIAVAAEEGLVVPVVRDADRKSFAEIEREIAELATRARDNTLTLDDLRGGTFTITNGGVFGSLMSTPILSPPQVGILGMHTIQQRPVARDGEVAIRPMMYLALSYDHRIVDGAEAVRFLVRVKELIEDPEALLLEA